MSNLSLDEVKQRGYVDREPVTKQIQWKDEDGNAATYDVQFVRLSFGEVERIQSEMDKHSAGATMISRMARFDGQKLTQKQAGELDPELAGELLRAISEVNGSNDATEADGEGPKD